MAVQRIIGHSYPPVSLHGQSKLHQGDVHNHFELSDNERNCHRSFKTSDYEQQKNVNPEHAPGTCEWVTEHPNFKRWHESDRDELLWISADPGCGKSVLSRYLVDTWLPERSSGIVSYYFFKDNDQQSRLAPALSAILHQIFARRRDLVRPCVLPAWNDVGEHLSQEVTQMWRILENLEDPESSDRAPLVVCVIDALDECRDHDRRQLIEFLCCFCANGSNGSRHHAILKFLVTSRPYDTVERWFSEVSQQFPNIRLRGEDENNTINGEINLVIRSRIQNLAEEFSLSLATRNRLLNGVLDMKHRTYLWVHLAFEDMREALQDSLQPNSVKIIKVPSSVEDAYERILGRVRSTQVPMVKRILKIIIGARRPFTIEEMALALTVATAAEDVSRTERYQVNFTHISKQIRHWCGLFVFVNDMKLYLIHQTAKEFLIGNEQRTTSNVNQWQGSLNENECESLMATITTHYLLMDRVLVRGNSLSSQLASRPNVEETVTFFTYCALHWMAHLDYESVARDRLILRNAVEPCDMAARDSSTNTGLWVYWSGASGKKALVAYNLKKQHVAAFLGNVAVLQVMYDTQNFDVNASCRLVDSSWPNVSQEPPAYGDTMVAETALTLAVRCGHLSATDWLIRKGAFINNDCVVGRVPLVEAVRGKFVQIVRSLLDVGASANVRDNKGNGVLHLASANGHLDIVEMLLNHDAQIDLPTLRNKDTALHRALRSGNKALHLAPWSETSGIAHLLMERGADVNATNAELDAPLHLAFRSPDIVQIMLEKQASVHQKNAAGYTPFQIAFHAGCLDTATLLLQAGAQPTFDLLEWAYHRHCPLPDLFEAVVDHGKCLEGPEGNKTQALRWAAAWGHYTSVAKLVQKHADVHGLDGNGRDALDIAIENNHQITCALLVASGAQPSTLTRSTALAALLHKATPLHRIDPSLLGIVTTHRTLTGHGVTAGATLPNRSLSPQATSEATFEDLMRYKQPLEYWPSTGPVNISPMEKLIRAIRHQCDP